MGAKTTGGNECGDKEGGPKGLKSAVRKKSSDAPHDTESQWPSGWEHQEACLTDLPDDDL